MLGDGWDETTPPLGAVVRETEEQGKTVVRLYGRGACDMKSGLACALLPLRLRYGRPEKGESFLTGHFP